MKATKLVWQVKERLFPELGCTDGGCIFGNPGGMQTNGGCHCMGGGSRDWMEARRAAMALSQIARTIAAMVPAGR